MTANLQGSLVLLVTVMLHVQAVADDGDHWAFRPLPEGEAAVSIDESVRARLRSAGMEPAPAADRLTLIRRVYLDLHGLPPAPEKVADFLAADDLEAAYETLVDELLASPRYGERWAQHWLDLVRYADTHGFEVNTERANAWPYRDYVIRAFNEDRPYDRFVFEQLAGDSVGEDAATGFLVAAAVLLPGQIGKDDVSKRQARQDALDEIVVATGDTFLALSVGCARCHDHKFDPVSQRDYFGLQAFFTGVKYGERRLRDPGVEDRLGSISEEILAIGKRFDIDEPIASPSGGEGLRPPVDPLRNIERIQPTAGRFVRFTILETIDNNRHEPCIDELEIYDREGRNIAPGGSPSSSGDRGGDPQHQLAHINDGRYGNGRSWISDQLGGGWVQIELVADSEIERIVWGRDRQGKFADRLAQRYRIEVAQVPGEWKLVASSGDRVARGDPYDADVALLERFPGQPEVARAVALRKQLAAMQPAPQVFAGTFTDPEATYLLNRGNPEQRGERLQPAVPATLGALTLPEQTPDQARRVALANWIANAENPLTPRVIANRIWQYHFGRGLVDTPSDFGFNGTPPSHPALLDSLARELVSSGWSIKHLHRLILLSATYRQSDRIDPRAQALDRECRLLWRFPSRRLEAEAIRDSILSVSGQLDLKMGGPGFNLFKSRGGLNGFPAIESFKGDGLRRMIYAHKVRMERAPVFGAFDCPDAGQATPRRSQSTTAIQALNLFNGRFVIDQSKRFAARIGDGGVARAFQLAYGRDPNPGELAACEQTVRHHGMATLCRVLLNSNEFLFLP